MRRTAILTAVSTPSRVTVRIQIEKIFSPGVRNMLKSIVMTRMTAMAFMPLTMNLNGTFESLIKVTRTTVARP